MIIDAIRCCQIARERGHSLALRDLSTEQAWSFAELAQRVPGPSVNLVAQRASEFGVHVAFGMASKEKVESILFDSAVLVGPDGDLVGEYRKVHLKGEEKLAFLTTETIHLIGSGRTDAGAHALGQVAHFKPKAI
jgi:predicted amidohydrolase